LTRDLVNIMSPEPEKQAKFHEALKSAVPRFLGPGSKALDGQAVPHRLYDHADSAAAAADTMRKKPTTKQAALPAAIPNSSETQPRPSTDKWKRLLPNSPAATGDPLLDAALRLNKIHDECIIAQINYDNSMTAASQHKLPSGVQYPPHFQQLTMIDQKRVASTTSILQQQQTNLRLSKDSFREVLNQPQKPVCKVPEQASSLDPSKGPVAQGNGSSAARGSSTTPSANPAGEHSADSLLSYLLQYAVHQWNMTAPAAFSITSVYALVCSGGHSMTATA